MTPRKAGSPPRAPRRPLAGLLLGPASLLAVTWVLISTGFVALRSAEPIENPDGRVERIIVPNDPQMISRTIAKLEKEVDSLSARNRRLRRRVRSLRPRGIHLVIDTGSNHMYLMRGDTVLRDALVSTGSGVRLADPDNPRSWIFDTPRGEFHIRRKIRDPVWTKPDWAFIEVGESVPSFWKERIERGVLGDFALDLGDGYLIHGTLFERALGLHVTHGCVRVGASDLEAIFRSVKIGTKVFII